MYVERIHSAVEAEIEDIIAEEKAPLIEQLAADYSEIANLNTTIVELNERIRQLEEDEEPEEPTVPPRSVRPARGESFGPDGTNYPAHTPWVYDPNIAHVIELTELSWSAIRTAILSCTLEMRNAGVMIVVPDGVLPGNGSASSSSPVLTGVGDTLATQNILIRPKTFGGLKFTNGIRWTKVHGISIFGIDDFEHGFTRAGCNRTAIIASNLSAWLNYGLNGQVTFGTDTYEVVTPEEINERDSAGVASGSAPSYLNGNAAIANVVVAGCYIAPKYRPEASQAHQDGLQFFGSGPYYGITVENCAIFGPNNGALQLGGDNANNDKTVPFLTSRHNIIVGAQQGQERYPVPATADPLLSKDGQAVNGAGAPGRMTMDKTIIIGTHYPTTYGKVTDSVMSYANDKVKALEGGFEVRPGVHFNDFDVPVADANRLKELWD